MRTVTLTNSFHRTSAVVHPVLITDGRFAGLYRITRKTALRLRRELCGAAGCCCGGTFGERDGARLEVVNEDSARNYIVRVED